MDQHALMDHLAYQSIQQQSKKSFKVVITFGLIVLAPVKIIEEKILNIVLPFKKIHSKGGVNKAKYEVNRWLCQHVISARMLAKKL